MSASVNLAELEIDASTAESIGEVIGSDASPVGIDAKKTHVLILHQLLQINQRLTKLERQLAESQ